MYIYAEYLIIENIVINYIILYVTGKLTKTNEPRWRLIIASVIGALYTLVVFYPSLRFMTKFTVKICVSMLMIIIAFSPEKLKKFIKLISSFYIISFVFAGAALALFYIYDLEAYVGNGIFYITDFPLKLLIIAVILSWILIKFTIGFVQKRINKERNFILVSIELDNNHADIMALVDTGNSLQDPITHAPVIVVQFSAIKDILPVEVQSIFLKYKENNLNIISTVMSRASEKIKFRVIPFKSLGNENGMLLGFKPDNVIIKGDENRLISNIVIGIYNSSLSNDEEYVALLHPEILN